LGENLEAALWAAIRQFEQKANMQGALAEQEETRGHRRVSASYRDRGLEARTHAAELRKLLHAAIEESVEVA
jgi:hypothetical protein